MARGLDNIKNNGNALGFDMVTGAHETRAHPSLANGTHVTGLAGNTTSAGSPGAVLGTGSNTDRSTPGIEAV